MALSQTIHVLTSSETEVFKCLFSSSQKTLPAKILVVCIAKFFLFQESRQDLMWKIPIPLISQAGQERIWATKFQQRCLLEFGTCLSTFSRH